MTNIINQPQTSNQLITNINEMCKTLFNSIDKNAFKYLDKLAFFDDKSFRNSTELEMIGNNFYEGMIGIGLSVLIGIVLYYIINYFIKSDREFLDYENESDIKYFMENKADLLYKKIYTEKYDEIVKKYDIKNIRKIRKSKSIK